MQKKRVSWGMLLCGSMLFCASCHLVLDIGKKDLPNKDTSTTVCAATADCDDGNECTQDVCELPAGQCTYFLYSSDVVCRPSEGECDPAEHCDGENPLCPPDEFSPETEVCRESTDPTGTCDPAEYCTGEDADCPPDVVAENGTACSDGDECTYDDVCDGAGTCAGTNGLSGVTYLSAAGKGAHTCSVLFDGREARCWGSGSFFQLGNGTADSSPSPVRVYGLLEDDDVLQVSSGGYHTCALLHSGRLMCWGRNDFGQLGIGSLDEGREPMEVGVEGSFPAWDFVSAGYYYTCAVHRYDGVYCWGANDRGQLGNGTTERQTSPTLVTGLSSRPVRVSAGYTHTCAVLDTGAIQCWGDDVSGQLGNEAVPEDHSPDPVDVVGLPAEVLAVSLGNAHTCALVAGGEVWCWGDNARGQLGSGTGTGGSTPVAAALGAAASTLSVISASTLSSGQHHSCALMEDGQVQCWGAGGDGQLGSGATDDEPEPVGVTGLESSVTAVSCGYTYTCVLFETGTVHCWGSNDSGELGNGTSGGESLVPVQVLCD